MSMLDENNKEEENDTTKDMNNKTRKSKGWAWI